MSTCCGQYGCRRRKPIKVRQGPFSGRWFVITAYTEKPNNAIRVTTKHDVTDDLIGALLDAGWTPPSAVSASVESEGTR